MKDTLEIILKLAGILALFLGFNVYLDSRYTRRDRQETYFGDRLVLNFNAMNHAETDGIVTAYLHSEVPARIWGEVGMSEDVFKLTKVAQDILYGVGSSTLTFTVRRGEYWRVMHESSKAPDQILRFTPLQRR